MNVAPVESSRRVVLVVDACSDTRTLVDLAVDLVLEMTISGDTHLQGLFIEDEDLLSAADLPCSREISHQTASQRPTSRDQMSSLLRRQFERFNRYLEQEARSSQLSWSSSSQLGRSSASLSVTEVMASCYILGRPLSRPVRAGNTRVRRIILLEHDSPVMLQVLQTVIKQLQSQRLEVVLFRPAKVPEPSPSMRAMVQAWQQDFPLLSVREYPREQLDELLENPISCDYVILSAQEPEPVKQRISRRLTCSMLLVH